jgi:hypothetical protein
MRAWPENSKYRLVQNESRRLISMNKSVQVVIMIFRMEDCIFAYYPDTRTTTLQLLCFLVRNKQIIFYVLTY